jgi:hypothetical protein
VIGSWSLPGWELDESARTDAGSASARLTSVRPPPALKPDVSGHPRARLVSSPPPFAPFSVFPQFSKIRSISAAIMAAVVRYLVNSGLGTVPPGWEGHDSGEGLDWRHLAASAMWSPASSSRL